MLMVWLRGLIVASLVIAASHANARNVRVVVDILPLHSLAAQVMEGAGEPHLLIPSNASPHHHALRPSQARALGDAELVFWLGEKLTPWLAEPLALLADDAIVVEISALPDLTRLSSRAGGVWDDHEDHHDHDDEDHGDHDEHAHDREEANLDPHLWLDPANARSIVRAMAQALTQIDPENASLYAENAAMALATLDKTEAKARQSLASVADRPYIVFHDAYQYFEERFGLNPVGSVTLNDGEQPGARRIHEIREKIRDHKAECVFAEPQFPVRAVMTVLEGTNARLGTLDPMGSMHEPGPQLYTALIGDLADGLSKCLTPQ